MPSQIISNSRQLMELVTTMRGVARELDQRALIALDPAPRGWSKMFAESYNLHIVCSAESGIGEDRSDRADRITAVLGSQQASLVFVASRQLDAGLLAAVAGTVSTGGVLIIDLGAMHDRMGAETKKPASAESATDQKSDNFNQRLRRLISQASTRQPSLSMVVSVDPDLLPESNECQQARASHIRNNHQPSLPGFTPQEQAISEQTRLYHQATQHLSTYPNGCLLISGRRGRGKSMLLVRIANWLAAKHIAFSVTSNHPSALQTFRTHFTGTQDPTISHESALQKNGGVLLLDEASNMSIRQLHLYLANYQQLVLSSTTEGYENAGRAFIVRFCEQLEKLNRPTLQLRPEWPWRWHPGDYLEQTIDELLLSNQSARDSQLEKRHKALMQTSCNTLCRRVDRTELALDENLLYEIHSLLSNNHYQYSVKDLQHILNGASLQIWVLEIEKTIAGCLVLEIEGEIDPRLHESILDNKRRLPHQLLPQLLALRVSLSEVLTKRFARVVRIAIVPGLRRRRYASRLLNQVELELQQNLPNTSAIGASFANDASSVAFWRSNGYVRFNTGTKINPRTGTTSIAVMKSWDPLISDAVAKLSETIPQT